MEEIKVPKGSTSMDLKTTIENKDVLQEKCDQLRMEKDEAMQRKQRLQQVVHRLYTHILDVFVEEDTPLEVKLTNIGKAI